MTRAHTQRPVWTWYCDQCGLTSGDLAYSQAELPTMRQMRARGWHIAEKFGDLCPACVRSARTVERFNTFHPVGTPVRYWPGTRDGAGVPSKIRTPAWALGDGRVVVSVEGYGGGIALSHVEVAR